jgi:patatin-like phospholipase/acyl hydrolase
MKETFLILSIDGGGIRGIFPALVLDCISQRLNINLNEYLDMIAGTSTGSIIASAIACKVSTNKILTLYEDFGKEIFTARKLSFPLFKTIFRSKYSNLNLKRELEKIFGEIRLGDISMPLLIASTDIGNGTAHLFRSDYSKGFTRDRNVLVSEAILASCSAPLFFDPTKVGNYLLADGGIWANNPSLAALIDAQKRLNIDFKKIKILSIGTGTSRKEYEINANKNWGLITGWKGTELISFIMNIQSQSIHNYIRLLVRDEQILRLNFETDLPLPLDDWSNVDNLISRADKVFTYESAKIRKFFNL